MTLDKKFDDNWNCIICGNNMNIHEYVKITYPHTSYFYKCKKCTLIFEDPNLRSKLSKALKVSDFQKEYLEIEEVANENDVQYHTVGYDNPDLIILSIYNRCKEYFFKSSQSFSFLEIGCANGLLIHKIISTYPLSKGVGIDPSKSSYKLGQKKNIDIRCGTLETPGIVGEEKFNYIICIGNLMLHRNPFYSIKLMINLLEKDGILIFDFKNANTSIRLISKLLYSLPLLKKNKLIQYIISLSYSTMRYCLNKKVIKNYIKSLPVRIVKIESYPPRKIEFKNQTNEITGIKGLIWRFTDLIDQIRNERAWVQFVVKKETP